MPTVADAITETFPETRLAVRQVPVGEFTDSFAIRPFYHGPDASQWGGLEPANMGPSIVQGGGRGPTTRFPVLKKRKRKRKLIPVKTADQYGSLEAYGRSDRLYVDMVQAWIQANQVFPSGGRARGRSDSVGITRGTPRTSQLGRRQGGFVAPKGVKAPPAAPRKPAKPPAPPWQPPKPPRKPPAPPRTPAAALPGTPGKVRKVPVRPWEGAARVSKSGVTGSELAKAVGIQTRVKVGRGLEVMLPPVGKLETVRKAAGALAKARATLGKLEILKGRGGSKPGIAGRFPGLGLPAKLRPPPTVQRVLELVRQRLDLPRDVKEPNDSLVDPSTPELARRDLTRTQEQGLRSRSKACECPEVKPKKKRLSCRQGYFRETARGITYKTWSTRKCPV